ncbi:MAG: chromosome segregation protein SMC [Candidatus Schekmanbacteria bacterium RBG_16_38_11]|uniref:Chromosome partition protein Smc n=1 Tax=Candidatus Schekmanbacteria bacterium RBG_16_38_11 TaxID=1817880 RepID=A0A1F7RX28_9BACT|nr:MAG: chromosome segregation protein SMC [Candidatus Schekmanbacteria bacterium RBG_16_38_11]
MRIEKFEAIGFKSFADKIEIDFQPGITAIVGPNGCGKSNISDAISWVLGEQSAKHLRGGKMEDVIFNGSETRKPLSMAEVTLTVSDDNGGFNSLYKEFKEVMITRRLYRSGESEYFINRTQCRLKDIHELFLDTGIGAKTCSIIKQGEVSELLTSHPEQRRTLIEEAAGIEKFQLRKKETERKLEHTKDNLIRLDDIIFEVKKQVNSLVRQARKAKVYNKFKEKIREFEVKIAALSLKKLEGNYKPLEENFSRLQDERIEKSSKLAGSETRLEELRLDILNREENLKELQKAFYEKDKEISGIESRIEILEKEISHMDGIKAKACEGINILKCEMEEITRELEERQGQREEIEKTLAGKRNELEGKEKDFEDLKKDVSAKLEFIEAEKNKIVDLITNVNTIRNTIQEGEIRIEDLNRRIKIEEEEKEKEKQELQEVENRISALVEETSKVKEKFSRVSEEIKKTVSSLEEKETQFLLLEKEIKEVSDYTILKVSEFSSLKKILDNHEGFDRGVKSLLKERDEKSESCQWILGTLSDFIETSPGYEVAIEAVLKDRLQNIIVESQDDALKALEFLKESQEGRSSFIPLKPRQTPSYVLPIAGGSGSSEGEKEHENGSHIPAGEGVVGKAIDFIKYPERYAGIINYLLSDVIIVENFKKGYELWRNNGNGFSYASLSGDIITPAGIITGGATDVLDHGLLMKKREVKELEEEIKGLSAKREELEQKSGKLKEEISGERQRKEALESELREIQVKQVHLEKDLEIKRETGKRVKERIEQISFEIEGLLYEKEEFANEIKSYREKLTEQEEARKSAKSDLTKLQESLGSLQDRLEKEREKLTELKVEVAREEEEEKRLNFQIESLKDSLDDLGERILHENQDITDADQKINEAHNTIGHMKTELEKRCLERDEIRDALTLRKADMEKISAELNNLEADIRLLRKDHEVLNQALSELGKQRTEISIEINSLNKSLSESYSIKPEDAKEMISEEENVNLLAEELQKFKSKTEKIGLVNLAAINEYETQKARLDFMETQKKDLLDSSEALKKTISKISKTSKERFIETFNLINEKFKEVFQLFFSGGQAELRLVDDEDILKAGVEIIAQPPGKKLQNVSLLSGGEKALTFISLLFAVFLIKPSPFCLLDEVDAPLDESNVLRLNNFIKKLSDKTQFLVITHANRTMETADVLYGITMEEPGVSKPVSVRFREEGAKEVQKQKGDSIGAPKYKQAELTA